MFEEYIFQATEAHQPHLLQMYQLIKAELPEATIFYV